MKVLLITPVEQGSGETVTCLHLAEDLVSSGHEVLFLASTFAARFLRPHFPDRIRHLGSDGGANRQAWDSAIQEFRPDAVVFADYPLMFFEVGAVPLVDEPGWQESLGSLDACLVTLDHFGFAQEEMGMFIGPPHLSFHYQRFPAIPDRMNILLPCPMHEPGPVATRRGTPFRYWQVPIETSEESRRNVRARYLKNQDDILVFHSVPNWAWRHAENMELPLYYYLGAILDYYLRDLPRPVTVVSVNNGSLLQTPIDASVSFVNVEPIPKAEFESLLWAADLALTENSVSISMGKAICGLQTCGAFRNTMRLPEIMDRVEGRLKKIVLEIERERAGTIFPFNAYPVGMVEELERIILYRDNSLTEAFESIELFGGVETSAKLRALLTDDGERERLRRAAREYVRRLGDIDDGVQALERLVLEERPAQTGATHSVAHQGSG